MAVGGLAEAADADRGRGLMEMTRSNWTIAADRLSRARDAQLALGNVRSAAISGLYLALALEQVGDVDAARATLTEGLAELERLEDRVTTAAVLGGRADLEARDGRLSRADSLYL